MSEACSIPRGNPPQDFLLFCLTPASNSPLKFSTTLSSIIEEVINFNKEQIKDLNKDQDKKI